MDQLEAAEESYAMALETDPSLRRSKAFRVSSLRTFAYRLCFSHIRKLSF